MHMKTITLKWISVMLIVFTMGGYFVSCTHEDDIESSSGTDIQRGTEKVSLATAGTTFDKAHSNVNWSSQYLGATSLLTGRFDNFGFNSFTFDESNPAAIQFEAWVWLNTVNTSEPGRDDGCLLGTFGTTGGATTEPTNLAILTSKSVEFSTTDKGYNVVAVLDFHGVKSDVTCKLTYDGKTVSGTPASDVWGFGLQFQFLAKSVHNIASTSVGDNATVKCNAVFKKPQ